jgi:hypothetical protein
MYLDSIDTILLKDLKNNLTLCVDSAGNPLRPTMVKKITEYLINPPTRQNIGRGIAYSGTAAAFCLSCTMGI